MYETPLSKIRMIFNVILKIKTIWTDKYTQYNSVQNCFLDPRENLQK